VLDQCFELGLFQVMWGFRSNIRVYTRPVDSSGLEPMRDQFFKLSGPIVHDQVYSGYTIARASGCVGSIDPWESSINGLSVLIIYTYNFNRHFKSWATSAQMLPL